MLKQGIDIQKIIIKVWLGTVCLLVLSPGFVLAEKCYVNDDASSGGDGSKDNPYKTIVEALDEDCDNVKIKKGKYEDDIVLGKGVELDGSGKSTIIKGKVTMNDETKLEHLYVKGEGVVVEDGADVFIQNVKITGADIGIKTIGEGKLTVKKTEISHGEKGFYLQYGKDVDIRDCDVSHNKEEAIDIRANVDGIITNNVIESNKESGIEVIAGRSSLIITNNKLKYNNASGIAVQFYKSTKNIGDLKISGNTLIGNRRYGVDCKIPSGGKPMPGYWDKSVHFQYNNLSGNGLGELSEFCKFSEEAILRATKTEAEIEEIKKKAEALKVDSDEVKEDEISEEEQIRIAEKRKMEEQKRADLDTADKIEQILEKDDIKLENLKDEEKQLLEGHSALKVFFMGEDENILNNFQKQITLRKKALTNIEKKVNKINTDEVRRMVDEKISNRNNELKSVQESYDKYNNKFALIPWVKSLFKK